MTRHYAKPSGRRVPNKATPWIELKDPTSKSPEMGAKLQTKTPKKIAWKRSHNVEELSEPEVSIESKNLKKNNRDEYKRRKPLTDIPPIYKGDSEIGIVRFEGFPVMKSDAERLKELKNKLLSSKVPQSQIKSTMKLERRRAEKALAREKKKLCFHCRKSGHMLSECPELKKGDADFIEAEICFKCGSTEHMHMQCHIRGEAYKHATCFICKQEGHISKQCPDNPRGLYPEGGGCLICGDVTHLKKDCLKFNKQKKEDYEITVQILDSRATDALDDDLILQKRTIPNKTIKKKKLITM